MAARSNQAATEPITEVAGFRGTGSQSLNTAERIVLIISEWATTQQAFIAHGYTPMFLHVSQLHHSTNVQPYTEQLSRGMFCFLWITLPSATRMSAWGSAGTDARLRQIRAWMEIASKSNVPAVLYGFFGKIWEGDILQRLLIDSLVHKSIHRWCHFGVRLWQDGTVDGPRAQPSARAIRMFSTFHFPSHLCDCPPNTEHYADTKTDNHNGRGRSRAERALLNELLTTLVRLGRLGPSRAPESNNNNKSNNQRLVRAGLSESLPSNSIPESGFQLSCQSSSVISNTPPQTGTGSRSHVQEEIGQRRLENSHGVGDLLTSLEGNGSRSQLRGSSVQSNGNNTAHQHNTPPPSNDNTNIQPAYPTDQRERQKQAEQHRKATNTQPTQRRKLKKHVEDHHDDCGEDLRGLGEAALWSECQDDIQDSEQDEVDNVHLDADVVYAATTPSNLCPHFGSECPSGLPPQPAHVHIVANMYEMNLVGLSITPGVDIVELCGGEGRCTTIARRRRLNSGGNFDIVTGTDLTDPIVQQEVLFYLRKWDVLVVVMAPVCRPFGPWAQFNKVMHYDTWRRSYEEAAPLARFCGRVALSQLEARRHFINEQPRGSELYLEDPWQIVLQWPGVVEQDFDQCRTGLRARTGLLVKKRTSLKASHPALVYHFRNLFCDGSHPHQQLAGNNFAAEAQVWTWDFSSRIINGITRLRKSLAIEHGTRLRAFPSIAAGPGPEEGGSQSHSLDKPAWHKCPGCRGRQRADDPRHTREAGVCKFPLTETVTWDCEGCRAHAPRSSDRHSYKAGLCKWATAPMRSGAPRAGRHPRPGRVPADAEPTADLPGPNLGLDDEAEAIRLEQQERARESEPSSSSGRPTVGLPESSTGGSAASSSGGSPEGLPESSEGSVEHQVAVRGPDQVARTRRTFKEEGTGEAPNDWTKFDVGSSLRALKTGSEATRRRILRKLHLRWWHATASAMERTLKMAGCPQDVLQLIHSTVDTCRICRAWRRPQPSAVASLDVAGQFNDQVECDLIFIERLIICHMVCRCIRWHVGDFVTDKLAPSLLSVIDKSWVRLFGPMRELIVDGESALNTEEALQYFERHGITRVPRAPQQHARYIERRGAMLRDQWHRSRSQLQQEGVAVSNDQLLTECILAGNCLIAVGGSTPYNALFGRQPGVLPALPEPAGNDTQRIREVATQQMIEGTASAKTQRALRTATRPSAAERDFKVGDIVEFHRPPANKDTPGWHGPARVCDTTDASRGQIGVKWQGRVLTCRLQDVRHELAMLVYTTTPHNHTATGAWDTLRLFVTHLPQDKPMTLGLLHHNGKWQLTRDTTKHPNIYHAARHYANTALYVAHAAAVRVGRGCSRLLGRSEFDQHFLIWWRPSRAHELHTLEGEASDSIGFRAVAGDAWQDVCFVQWLSSDEDVANQAQQQAEEAHQQQLLPPPPPGGDGSQGLSESPAPPEGQLSPIPEGTERDDSTTTDRHNDNDSNAATDIDDDLLTLFSDFDTDSIRSEILDAMSDVESCKVEASSDLAEQDFADLVGVCLPELSGEHLLEELGDETLEDKVYLEFPAPFSKLIDGVTEALPIGQAYAITADALSRKKQVVSTDSDLLTPAEVSQHKADVLKAMQLELATWHKHKCFERRLRRKARNIIDCRWVLKWKVTEGPRGHSRTIRARLTVRGFKDRDAASLESYAGTSTRWSQRIVASQAVLRGWRIVSADVAKAFLQGVTYAELSRITGKPLREVCFDLPSNCVHLLRTLPGYADYDPTQEVLACTKPGTGLRDAPKAFALKLGQVTRDGCGLKSVSTDSELEVLHIDGNAELLMAKHVDDLKIAGTAERIKWMLSKLEAVFGSLTVHWDTFTNCGVRHQLDVPRNTITLDQAAYIAALKPIVHRDLVGSSAEDPLEGELYTMFRSLLGAIAWCNMTRCDIMVYVVALQRIAHKPRVIHARRLNAVVRYAQRNPRSIKYAPLGQQAMSRRGGSRSHSSQTGQSPYRLLAVTDSSFKKEEDDGHAMKGVFILLGGGSSGVKTDAVHVLDYAARKQHHVTRSTFAAELFSACDGVDHALMLAITLHEIERGCSGAGEARRLREEGGLAFSIWLCIDAMSVLAATSAEAVRAPTEKSLMGHVLWLRELADRGLLTGIAWVDTRDMLSDGLTKGSVARDLIDAALSGKWAQQHAPKEWQSTLAMRRTTTTTTDTDDTVGFAVSGAQQFGTQLQLGPAVGDTMVPLPTPCTEGRARSLQSIDLQALD